MLQRDAPKNLLFVIDYFKNPNAGTEGQLYSLIKGLDRTRFNPVLLVFRESKYLQEKGFPCDYYVLGHTRLLSPATWMAMWRFAKKARAMNISVAHIFFNDPSVICPPILRVNGIRVIISRRDMGYWYNLKYRFMLAMSGRFVSRAIVNSKAVGAVTSINEPLNSKKISIIYNGYEFYDSGDLIPHDISSLRRRYPEAIFIVLVANVRPIKRISDAIHALVHPSLRDKNLHLVVIGDGDLDMLKSLSYKLELGERVHLLGPRSDVRQCLNGFDIGVLCSESEGFSNAIVEYMQAGLPVVCSNVGGNPEAVSHGENGFLYPVGDISALASYLDDLYKDSSLRHCMGKESLRTATERFSMRRMVMEHERVYESLSEVGSEH
ncbi:glycosyltransferase [Marinobacter sp. RI1]|uniref:glycosyltransferase n=1 Tax=Marinobacter sp. RI1 TaxID=3158171 RepID=UPI0034E8BCF3